MLEIDSVLILFAFHQVAYWSNSLFLLCATVLYHGIDVAYIYTYITVYKIIILKSQYFYTCMLAVHLSVSLDTFCSAFQKFKNKNDKTYFPKDFFTAMFYLLMRRKKIYFSYTTMSDVYLCITLF
jgi:hypothetical protein